MARKRRRNLRKNTTRAPLQRRRAHLEKLEDRWVIGSMLLSLPGGAAALAAQSLLETHLESSLLPEMGAKRADNSASDPSGFDAWDSSLLKTWDDDSTHLDMAASGGASAASDSWEESPPTSDDTSLELNALDAHSADARADLLIDSYLAAAARGKRGHDLGRYVGRNVVGQFGRRIRFAHH